MTRDPAIEARIDITDIILILIPVEHKGYEALACRNEYLTQIMH